MGTFGKEVIAKQATKIQKMKFDMKKRIRLKTGMNILQIAEGRRRLCIQEC
jgi:hypothetical protein